MVELISRGLHTAMNAITCVTLFASLFVLKASFIQAAVAYDLIELSTCGSGRGFTADLLLTNASNSSAEDLHALSLSVRSVILLYNEYCLLLLAAAVCFYRFNPVI